MAIRHVVLAAALLLPSLAAECREGNATFDAMFEQTFERYALPGMALGIVENGESVYTRTQGELLVGSGNRIDNATLFKIASNSKAMTAALLARLVDQGKLRWDDPVTKHLPQFRMFDPWVTKQMQVRDLLIHNSGLGLGAGDLMLWPEPNGFTRADVLAGIAHLKPTHSFRSHYNYDNILYIVAGEVAAAAGGAPYETLMQREIFESLKMTRCQAGAFARDEIGNVAQPHLRDGERNVPVRLDGTQVPVSTMNAAGGIRCSLDDMLTWAKTWLTPEGPWLSAEQRTAVWTPHMPLPLSAQTRAWEDANFYAYGYGWRLSDANGQFKAAHTGTLSGMYSYFTLLPETRSGWVILINGNGGEARMVLNQALVKHFTDRGNAKSVEHYADELAKQAATATKAAPPRTDTTTRVPASASQLRERLGVYRDPWFGEVSLCAAGDGVEWRSAKSPQMAGAVQRVGEAWLIDWFESSVDAEAWLQFNDGGMTLSHVDPDADFSYDYADLAFTRSGDCQPNALTDIATLVPDIDLDMKYAGTDNFVGTKIDGYEAPRCLLLPPVAQALARVEQRVRADGYRLRLHDCYRPVRAVAHFMRWAGDATDQRTKSAFYPDLDKSKLVPDYIAEQSGHSRAATVDLTLLRCEARCEPLDMGTPFDFFDARANTDSPRVTEAQRANRYRLRDAMRAEGFENYPMEWWHYTLPLTPPATQAFDTVVR